VWNGKNQTGGSVAGGIFYEFTLKRYYRRFYSKTLIGFIELTQKAFMSFRGFYNGLICEKLKYQFVYHFTQ
jgi:hypothetical protein